MKKFLAAVILLLYSQIIFSQTISGIINNYAQVISITGTTISTTSLAGFAAGDQILVIQMKGATINSTNSSAYGDVSNYNNSGNWEFATVSSISGNDITISAPLVKTYSTSNGLVQAVTVPSYCDVTITDTLKCKAWDGLTGGVVAFVSGGTVTMNADINTSGKGFRPGATCSNGNFSCNLTGWFYNPVTNCAAGWKGEGIAAYVNNAQSGGRGKLANGGGGSNRGNSGGGGGSNKGSGGLGGFEDATCGSTGIQGIGGAALDYALGKIFMGGAGGTSSGDDAGTVFPGGAGGGIVIMAANTLNPNGFSIRSEGLDVTGITNDEGASGGGGGGAVCLDIQSILSPLNVFVAGGDGGSIDNIQNPVGCQGPGGGGGGGILWVTGSSLSPNIVFAAAGGSAGLMLTAASSCFNTPNGATAGAAGAAIFNFPPQTLPTSLVPVTLGNDTTVCPFGGMVLATQPGFLTFLWQDGSTNPTFAVTDSGTYTVKASDATGCFSSDTVHVAFIPPYNYSIGNDTTVCFGDTILLDAGSGFTSYLWQDTSMLETFAAGSAGIYSVTSVDTIGCIGLAKIKINNFGLPPLDIGNDTSLCEGDKVVFNGGAFSNYLWQDGSSAPIFIATQPGTYYVTVTDFNGCDQSDTASLLSFYPEPPDTFLLDTIICTGEVILLEGPEGFADYLWSDSATTSAITVTEPGTYGLTITSSFGCKSSDSSIVTLKCPTNIFMPTAFTPNGDGLNDNYMALGYNINSFIIRIYNRWGQLLYISADITTGWNGVSHGIKAEMGTYVYYVTWTGLQDGIPSGGELKGNFTLIR